MEFPQTIKAMLNQSVERYGGRVAFRFKESNRWREVTYRQLVLDEMGDDWFDLSLEDARKRAEEHGLPLDPAWEMTLITHEVYEKLVEHTLIQPTMVTRFPATLIPLAKACEDDPRRRYRSVRELEQDLESMIKEPAGGSVSRSLAKWVFAFVIVFSPLVAYARDDVKEALRAAWDCVKEVVEEMMGQQTIKMTGYLLRPDGRALALLDNHDVVEEGDKCTVQKPEGASTRRVDSIEQSGVSYSSYP